MFYTLNISIFVAVINLNNSKNLVNKERKIVICMAHARTKFVYAFEQTADMDAKYLLDCIDNSLAERFIRPFAYGKTRC